MNKNRFPFLIVLIFALITPLSAFADSHYQVVLHLSNPHKLHVLKNNVNNLRKAFKDKVEIVAVINGPAVTKFAKFSRAEAQINHILNNDVDIQVCSIAMKNNKVLKKHLVDGVNYLDQGGVAQLITLQSQGYSYVKI